MRMGIHIVWVGETEVLDGGDAAERGGGGSVRVRDAAGGGRGRGG